MRIVEDGPAVEGWVRGAVRGAPTYLPPTYLVRVAEAVGPAVNCS